MLLPGSRDGCKFFLGNAWNFSKTLNIVRKYIKRLFAEMTDYSTGGFGPDTFYQARAKIFFQRSG